MFDQIHGRVTRIVPCKIIWSSLEEEYAADLTIARDLAAGAKPVMTVPAYLQHPAVLEATQLGRQRPVPMGVYMDGVQYMAQASGRNDTSLGFWAINLLSGRRHFVCATKNQDA
eukprot:4532292-Pyramimonas_sp.AAC.1